ncbi:MAG: inorganic phosphate transporter [Prevotella sp.]
METFYLLIVVFLLVLAVFDLFVGVSNDAVNFLNSAIGAKVAKFKTVMFVASFGVVIGAMMSAGMMDVARHGIMQPENYSFHEVMTIFLAVMVTDVIVLDMFNTLGLPTSTTVSLVFELLGGTFILALLKMNADGSLTFDQLLNSDKALSVIIAIFVSVAIAFFFGVIVQWIARVVFTFSYNRHLKYTIAIFGGIAFTILAYFIFIKGLSKSPFIEDTTKDWIKANTPMLMGITFVISTILMEIIHLLKVDVFKLVVMMGTFALAMAFAGNDLVNFIGVPMAGLDSFIDFTTNGNGDHDAFMMTSLMTSAKTPFLYLMLAGVIMIIAMATSKKAQNVVKTSVDLSRQDEGDEMFGSSRAARSIVRGSQDAGEFVTKVIPNGFFKWLDTRFRKEDAILADGAAFDVVRAAVNLVLASVLIVIGTTYKLPLSTTYVTFMVAMGTSLADRAWSRESAVFRVTGVLSVIGGWFITAGVAFGICAIVCLTMYFGGFLAMFGFMALVAFLLIRSNIMYKKKKANERNDDVFQLMMRTKDPEIVLDLLMKHVRRTQTFVCKFALCKYNKILDSLISEDHRAMSKLLKELKAEQVELKKYRRKELLALRRVPQNIALERNTWYHLGINSDQQYIYCLRRMLDPIKEHVDNNFNPMPDSLVKEFDPVREKIADLMKRTAAMISTGRFDEYDAVLAQAEELKDRLSSVRKHHYDRMQKGSDVSMMKIDLVYINILQESQELLSIMRHQLRAANRFYGNN